MLDKTLVGSLAVRDGLLQDMEEVQVQSSDKMKIASEDFDRLFHYAQEAVSQQFSFEDTANPRNPVVRNRFNNIVAYAAQKLGIEIADDDMPGVIQRLFDEILGYGPLEKYFFDPEVTDIIVNGLSSIRYMKAGIRHLAEEKFESVEQAYNLLQRMIAPTGRRLDVANPRVNARLFDGSRLIAHIDPATPDGFLITIRRFRQDIDMSALIRGGATSREVAEFLRAAILAKMNLVVAGGTSSGKTTWLNNLASYIPHSESIITIEDPAELQLQHPDVRRLEARPANVQGKGEITMDELVQDSLRMTPNRIIVGECRGGEAFTMLQAMNTGHPGSMTTVHSNSAKDAISRIVSMVLMRKDMNMPNDAILDLIFSAVDMIVYVVRDYTGLRRIDHIVELKDVVKASDGRTHDIELNLLWQYENGTWEWKPEEFLRGKAFAKVGWSPY